MLSTFRPRTTEASAQDVAARAADAALVAAGAAIRAADAAIKAADAAVRLIDEHNGEVIMLEPARSQPRENRREENRGDPWPPIGLAPAGGSASILRRKPIGLRARTLPRVLIVLGALVLLDAAVTLVWQEPFSALYAKLRQDHLSGALNKVERSGPTPAERSALARLPGPAARIEYLAREFEQKARNGSPVARISIPRIKANYVVVKGTSTSDLESGPGIYPETVFPGIPGTTAIAGHRTTYLAPFRHIDALQLGSRIRLNMPYAHFTYKVIGMRVVWPSDVRAVVSNVGYSRLVLSACTPPFSAEKRLLVFARLTTTVPVGAGRAPGAEGAGNAPRPLPAGAIESGLRPVTAAFVHLPTSGARIPQ